MVVHGAMPDKFLLPKILKACSELQSIVTGAAVHGFTVRAAIDVDVFVGNSLIDLYAKCGDFTSARAVFGQMQERDVVSWTALVGAYSNAGLLDEASSIFDSMLASGIRPDLISWNALVSGFARNGDIEAALCLLEKMQEDGITPGTNSWNGIISGCVQNGFFDEALEVFGAMHSSEKPNAITIASILPACSGLQALLLGKELHSYIVRNGIALNAFLGGSLINMYSKFRKSRYVEQVFVAVENKNATVWNEMIAAYADEDKMSEALELFSLMHDDGVKPDVVTYNIVIALYARKGLNDEAFELLSKMNRAGLKPNAISMNALISGFHHCGLHLEALDLFRAMQSPVSATSKSHTFSHDYGLVQPNSVSVTSALLVLADLKLYHQGKEVHCYILRNCLESSIFVSSTLVDMYAKCGDLTSALSVFRLICNKNTISWNILLSGCNHNREPDSTLRLFPEMLEQSFMPSSITLSILLLSCSLMMAPRIGRELHSYIEKNRPDSYPVTLSNALIDMYAKCGCIKEARLVFDRTAQKDVAIWNTMIAGYSLHRMPKDAIHLFNKMIEKSDLKPDRITFAALLSACNREDFIDEAWKYFDAMEGVYGVRPTLEHFTCMIDILGTAGLLEESLDIISRMPYEPDACLWATLLKSCRLHANYEIGQKAANALIELEPDNASNYVLLHNTFSMAGMWSSATRIRNTMKDRGLSTVRQCSRLYLGKTVHSFKAGDCSHPEMEKILDLWGNIADEMMQDGHSPQNPVFCKESEADPFACCHTEKLAICLGILYGDERGPVCVSKNIRMCMDCHSSIKFVSRGVTREIFVADGCTYHHFKDGKCSCRDKW